MLLCEEHEMVRKTAREFVEKEVTPVGYYEFEQKGEFPKELFEKLVNMGYVGMSFPEEYGGMGADCLSTSIVAAELAFGWPSLQLVWSANESLSGFPIKQFGSEEQKKRFLPELASGKMLGCYALTEPDYGSDAANIQATAELRKFDFGQRWVLNGTKTFITNADMASVYIVFARVKDNSKKTPKKRHEGITAFIVDCYDFSFEDCPDNSVKNSLDVVRTIPKWGLVSSHFCEVVLEDLIVRESDVLGGVGNGFNIAMETLNNGRVNIAAQSVGIARRALHEAKEYARHRKVFGRTILDIDEKAKRLAWLETQADAAWLHVMRAAQARDKGLSDYITKASQAKLFASEVAVECALFNYRIQGGFGYTKDSIAMPILHDALATVTYEGTSDIQELTIAKSFR
jgi:alkylation response protein AidB-like acyl-CoA dehydrogenase